MLLDGVDLRLKEIMKSICLEFDAELMELEIMPDYVHMLVEIDP